MPEPRITALFVVFALCIIGLIITAAFDVELFFEIVAGLFILGSVVGVLALFMALITNEWLWSDEFWYGETVPYDG